VGEACPRRRIRFRSTLSTALDRRGISAGSATIATGVGEMVMDSSEGCKGVMDIMDR
jgi:hypothetical protein